MLQHPDFVASTEKRYNPLAHRIQPAILAPPSHPQQMESTNLSSLVFRYVSNLSSLYQIHQHSKSQFDFPKPCQYLCLKHLNFKFVSHFSNLPNLCSNSLHICFHSSFLWLHICFHASLLLLPSKPHLLQLSYSYL